MCKDCKCSDVFAYGNCDNPCWFKELDKVETKFGNFRFVDVYVGDNCFRFRQGDVISKKYLGLA